MKRTVPLRRKTPMRRSRIKQVSTARAIANRIYGVARKQFLAEHPHCQCCDHRRSTQVHHTRGRTGKNFLDKTTWLAVDVGCHEWIHNNPNKARVLGWLV
jgi:hypothetical protein